MGDYTKNGAKIGTCGVAYYATKKMLEEYHLRENDQEVKAYLKPENDCTFAFPFPEFDLKKVGEISIFHKEERDYFQIKIKREGAKTFHKQIVFHKHPIGSQGINFFCDCPYHSEEKISGNFSEEYIKFHLKYQQFYNHSLAIVGECIFCGMANVFDEQEATEAATYILQEAEAIENHKKSSDLEKAQAKEKREIAKRIIETYQ